MTAPMLPEPCDRAAPNPAPVPPLDPGDLRGQLTDDQRAAEMATLHPPEEYL